MIDVRNGQYDRTSSTLSLLFSGVQNLSLQMSQISVPARSSGFQCYGLALPTNADYHVIATDSIVSTNIVKKVLVYGCKTPPNNSLVQCHNHSQLRIMDNCSPGRYKDFALNLFLINFNVNL